MSKYKKGIDFVVNTYEKREYLKLLVHSIHKYTKDIDYKIHIVNSWYGDDKPGLDLLNKMFGDDDKVSIVKGFDQTSTTVVQQDGAVSQRSEEFIGKIDGNRKQIGSKYTSDGLTLGIKNGSYEYVCLLDADVIFLNDWVEDTLPLSEKYFFIANRWDPGNLFKECSDNVPEKGMCKTMFFFSKRAMYEDNDLYPNIDYRDSAGNLTYFAEQNNKEYYVMKNTHWSEERRSVRGITYEQIKKYHTDEKHLLDIPYGEQAYINDIPIMFHQNRFLYNRIEKNNDWVTEASRYLNEN